MYRAKVHVIHYEDLGQKFSLAAQICWNTQPLGYL